MVLLAGIDEAGRGPVIGPMVMAGVLIEKKDIRKLKKLGVRDSKLLTRARREELYDKIIPLVKAYRIISLANDVIDASLFDSLDNLNKLEAKTSGEIINCLLPEEAYIDLPDRNMQRYCERIMDCLTCKTVKLVAEHKADVKYPVVSAASILAKVTRDREIEEMKRSCGHDFGSGYMTDPKTKIFLAEHWNDEDFRYFRKSWASWCRLHEEHVQKKLGQY